MLPKPFMVMATQNPVEYSGTFPLPEAQLDRFLMKVKLGYLTEKEEANLLNQHKIDSPFDELQPVVSPNELTAAQSAIREVFVKPELREYIARLVGRTRGNPEVALGASTRGTLHLFHAAQALAAIEGRNYVIPDDIKTLAEPVLAHRIILRPNAEMQGQSAGKLVAGLLEREHVPQMAFDGRREARYGSCAMVPSVFSFFTYLTASVPRSLHPPRVVPALPDRWGWPRLAMRGVSVTRKVDPGTPTVGETFEETFEVHRKGWIPAPWVEVRDLSQIPDYQPGRVISLGSEFVRWKARGVYRRRGWMALGPTSLRVTSRSSPCSVT